MNEWHLDLNLKMLHDSRACSDSLSLTVSFFYDVGIDAFDFIFINSYIPPYKLKRYPNLLWDFCQNSIKHIASLSNRKPGLKRNDKLLEKIPLLCYFFLLYFLLEFCVAPRSHFLAKAWYNKNLRLCVKCYWLQALEFS